MQLSSVWTSLDQDAGMLQAAVTQGAARDRRRDTTEINEKPEM